MERREESETADPQKESLRERRCGQPRERTSVAVSERAQQNDFCCSLAPESSKSKNGMKKVIVAREYVPNPIPATPLPHWSDKQ